MSYRLSFKVIIRCESWLKNRIFKNNFFFINHDDDTNENNQVREPSVETLSSLGGQQDEQFVDVQHPQSVLSRVQVKSAHLTRYQHLHIGGD